MTLHAFTITLMPMVFIIYTYIGVKMTRETYNDIRINKDVRDPLQRWSDYKLMFWVAVYWIVGVSSIIYFTT